MYAGCGRPFSLKSCFFCVVEQDSDEHSIFGVVFFCVLCLQGCFRRVHAVCPKMKIGRIENAFVLLFSSSARSG